MGPYDRNFRGAAHMYLNRRVLHIDLKLVSDTESCNSIWESFRRKEQCTRKLILQNSRVEWHRTVEL